MRNIIALAILCSILLLVGCEEYIGTHEATVNGTSYEVIVAEKTESPVQTTTTPKPTTTTSPEDNITFSGGEHGVIAPPVSFTVRVDMPDGSIYLMRTGSKIIYIDAETIRVFDYYVQYEGSGNWYFIEDFRDLPISEAIIR